MVATSQLEDRIVGALLAGYGDRAADLDPARFAIHGDLVRAWHWLRHHGGVRHRYHVDDGQVVLRVVGLREALDRVGAPRADRLVKVADALLRDLPIALASDVAEFLDAARRRQVRVALRDAERRLVHGDDVEVVARDVRHVLEGAA